MAGQSRDSERQWRWASASCIGTGHVRRGERKQDAAKCFSPKLGSNILCAVVCDGAGSAPFGGEGASLVCRILSTELTAHFQASETVPSDDAVWSWVDRARDSMAGAALARETRRQSFASTLLLLVATPQSLLTAHIGDGAIVARHYVDGWQALSWPENGEYASTTYFVTDDPSPRLRITRHEATFDAFAVFTDGIEDLALDFKARTAHERFFAPMIAPLDKLSVAGRDAALSTSLGTFLNSPRVCDRTDDDKSLILASTR